MAIRLVPAVLLGLCAGPALAQGRLPSVSLPCGSIVAVVAREGSVILGTGVHAYDRIVRDQSFCPLPTVTTPTYAPAADTPHCFVGYRCADRANEHSDRD